jgi:hypothetical protein
MDVTPKIAKEIESVRMQIRQIFERSEIALPTLNMCIELVKNVPSVTVEGNFLMYSSQFIS